MGTVTAGVDIGTTSVKAAAFDDEGRVVARARIPHRVIVPEPDCLEHDAEAAWRRGPRRALRALGQSGTEAVAISTMVPSMTAVDRRGRPLTPGLLYGDRRGATDRGHLGPGGDGSAMELLRWTAAQAPGAHGYWPAPAVASRALGAEGVVDIGTAFAMSPVFGAQGWDPEVCAGLGARPDQLPRVEMPGTPIGRVDGDGPVLGTGSVDGMCEALVAGADREGDVHVLCGTTLIIWAVIPEWKDVPGLWTIPHPNQKTMVCGGASNAGGLFLDWVGRMVGRPGRHEVVDPANLPVWVPYPRGERTPYHDPNRRAVLDGLDLTHGPAAVRRAAWEASGFVVRHHLDLAGVPGRRIVATGGGTRVDGWMQGLADATGLPVHVGDVPETAAQGAAFLARVAAGVESDLLEAARWARTERIVEPDTRTSEAAAGRYRRFLELSELGAPS